MHIWTACNLYIKKLFIFIYILIYDNSWFYIILKREYNSASPHQPDRCCIHSHTYTNIAVPLRYIRTFVHISEPRQNIHTPGIAHPHSSHHSTTFAHPHHSTLKARLPWSNRILFYLELLINILFMNTSLSLHHKYVECFDRFS